MPDIPGPVADEMTNLYSRILLGERVNPSGILSEWADQMGGQKLSNIADTQLNSNVEVPRKTIINAFSPAEAQKVYEQIQPPGPLYSTDDILGLIQHGTVAKLNVAQSLPMSIMNSAQAEARRLAYIHDFTGPGSPEANVIRQLSGADPQFLSDAFKQLDPDAALPSFGGPIWGKSVDAAMSGRVGKMVGALYHNYQLSLDLTHDAAGLTDALYRFKLPLLAAGGIALGIGNEDPAEAVNIDFPAVRQAVSTIGGTAEAAIRRTYLSGQIDDTSYMALSYLANYRPRMLSSDIVDELQRIHEQIKNTPADPVLTTTTDTDQFGDIVHGQITIPGLDFPVSQFKARPSQDGTYFSTFNVQGLGPGVLGRRGVKKVVLQLADQFPNIKTIQSNSRATGVAQLSGKMRAATATLGVGAGALALSQAQPSQATDELPEGMVEPGNIDLTQRPVVQNADGTYSTLRSISVGNDKGEVLIPTVVDGKVVSNEDAVKHYQQTGENLGTFSSVEAADKYAEQIHNQGQNLVELRRVQAEKAQKGEYSNQKFNPVPFDSSLVNEFQGLIDPEQDGIPTVKSLEQNPKYQALQPQQQVAARRLLFDQFYTRNPQLVQLHETDPAAWNRIRMQYMGLPPPGIGEKLVAAVGRGLLGSIGQNDPHRQIVEQTLYGQPGWKEKVAELAAQIGSFWPAMSGVKAVGLAMGVRAGLSEFAGNATIFGMQEAMKTRTDQAEAMMRLAEQQYKDLPLDPQRSAELGKSLQTTPAATFGRGFETAAIFDLGLRAGFKLAQPFYRSAKSITQVLWYGYKREATQVLAGRIPEDAANVIPKMEEAIANGPPVLDPATDVVQKELVNSPRFVVTRPEFDAPYIEGNSNLTLQDLMARAEANKNVRIFLKDGKTEISPDDLVNGYYRPPMDRDALGRFVEGSGKKNPITWDMVGEMRGSQEAINSVLGRMGFLASLADAPAVTVDIAGGQIRRMGRYWVLFDQIGQSQSFKTEAEVLQAAKKMQMSMGNLEGPALNQTTELGTGANVLEATRDIRNSPELAEHARQLGNAPPPGQPPDLGMGTGGDEINPPGGKTPAAGASVALGKLVAPPKATFLRIERQTKVPMFSELWQPMEESLAKMRTESKPWLNTIESLMKGVSKKQGEGYALALQVGSGTGAEGDLAKEFGLDYGKLKGFRGYFEDLFDKLGAGDSTSYFQQIVPRIQISRSLSKAYPDPNLLPPQLKVFANYIQQGRIPLWRDNVSIRQMMESHTRAGFWHTLVQPAWTASQHLWDGKLADPGIPAYIKAIAKNYLDDVAGKVTAADAALMQAGGKAIIQAHNLLTTRSLNGPGEGPISAEEAMSTFRKYYGWMFNLNYAANLGLRPAAVARQFLQTEQTTAVRFGHPAVWGKNGGVARLATKEGQDLVEKSGILMEEAPFHAEEGATPVFGKIFRRTHNVQRGIAALSQDGLLTRNLPTYLKRGDWDTFVRKSKLEFYDPIIQSQLKDMFDQGRVMDARLRAMKEASEDTQFIYRKGNQPQLFRGVGGRVFGQYGVWPSYYGNFLTQMATQGSLRGRAGQWARFITINAVLGKTFTGVLGASAAGWLYFQPLNFTGGPIFQIGTSAYTAAFGKGPERDLAKYRLLPQLNPRSGGKPSLGALGQFIPGHQAARDLYGTYKAAQQHDPEAMFRELLGYPKETKAD